VSAAGAAAKEVPMQIRLSGLRGRHDDDGQPLAERLAPLPAQILGRFDARLRDVVLHVLPESGDAREPAEARVAVRRRHGPPLVAAARGADAEMAARRALERARRLLRRDTSRRRDRRTRAAA